MKFIASAAIMIASILISPMAMAWGVIVSYDGRYDYIHYGHSTKAEAEKSALAACSKENGKGCEVLSSINGGALVVAKGDGGLSFAADRDPKLAHARALAECKKSYGRCRVMNAAWDEGVHWAAFAHGPKNEFFAYGAGSPESAIEKAIAGCEAPHEGKGECKVHGDRAVTDGIHVSFSKSKRANVDAFGLANTQFEADKIALESCRRESDGEKDCKIVARQANPIAKAAPASFKAIAQEVVANQKAPATPKKTVQTKLRREVTSCKTSCVNGDCTSVFENGRTVKWRAQWVYLPLEGRHGFKTDGCGG